MTVEQFARLHAVEDAIAHVKITALVHVKAVKVIAMEIVWVIAKRPVKEVAKNPVVEVVLILAPEVQNNKSLWNYTSRKIASGRLAWQRTSRSLSRRTANLPVNIAIS